MTHQLSQLHGLRVYVVAVQVRREIRPGTHHIVQHTAPPGQTHQSSSSPRVVPKYTKSQHHHHHEPYSQTHVHSLHLSLCFRPPALLKLQLSHSTALHYYRQSCYHVNYPRYHQQNLRLIYSHNHFAPNKAYQHENLTS